MSFVEFIYVFTAMESGTKYFPLPKGSFREPLESKFTSFFCRIDCGTGMNVVKYVEFLFAPCDREMKNTLFVPRKRVQKMFTLGVGCVLIKTHT